MVHNNDSNDSDDSAERVNLDDQFLQVNKTDGDDLECQSPFESIHSNSLSRNSQEFLDTEWGGLMQNGQNPVPPKVVQCFHTNQPTINLFG